MQLLQGTPALGCICTGDVTGATEDELLGQSVARSPRGEKIFQAPRAFLGSEGLILPPSWVGSAGQLVASGTSPRLERGRWEELPAHTRNRPPLAAII